MSSHARYRSYIAEACRRMFLLGTLAVAIGAIVPSPARAANTCNGQLSIDYVAGPNFPLPGDVVRVRLTLGTASITGGTELAINRLRFDLDCNSNFALGLPCTDEGSIVEYEGDPTITTTCGVIWSTGHGVSDVPNEVVFTPSSPVHVPAGQPVPPGFCNLEFDIKVLARSTDGTPDQIEQVTGFLASQGDGMCDNGLSASSTQSSSLPLCPTCNDQNDCTDDVCNQQDGTCTNPPTEGSTPCADTDEDVCTTAGCDGQGTCDQNHIVCVTTTTTTTITTTTTTTTPCTPQPENTTAACSDMVDNDCDGLIDCADPDCTTIFPCLRASKDPTIITFSQSGLDLIRGHAKLQMTPVDISAMSVGVLLSNPHGAIYAGSLAAGALTPGPSGTIFRFRNSDARTGGGIYSLKIKQNRNSSYTFGFASYGDLSAATDANMRLQFYIGDDANAARDGRIFITLDQAWTRTPRGWRAPKDH
jgi:hypothetical protein